MYVNELLTPHFSLNIHIAEKLLQQDLLIELAMWCAKWRIKLNPDKTKVIILSRSILARKTELVVLNLKLYGETLKIYPQVTFLGITFDSQLTFKEHFEGILDSFSTRYHRLRLFLANKRTKQVHTDPNLQTIGVRPIFEYGSLSTITTSDNIISRIQRLPNRFIRLSLRLPKCICTKLLHDSTGLPYVKDRLLSCATKSLDSRLHKTHQLRNQYHTTGSVLLGTVSQCH